MLCSLKIRNAIPYGWPFCPCLRSPVGTAFCADPNTILRACNKLCNMQYCMKWIQELTWSPQGHHTCPPISMLTSQEKKRQGVWGGSDARYLSSPERFGFEISLTFTCLLLKCSKISIVKIKIQEFSWETSKGWIQSMKHNPTDNRKLFLFLKRACFTWPSFMDT